LGIKPPPFQAKGWVRTETACNANEPLVSTGVSRTPPPFAVQIGETAGGIQAPLPSAAPANARTFAKPIRFRSHQKQPGRLLICGSMRDVMLALEQLAQKETAVAQ
jgi:hypothetical protein